MKKIILIILMGGVLLPWPGVPKAQAFEPITMVMLAPVAVKVYKEAEPRLVRGARTGGRHMIKTGQHMLEMFYLPLGVMQTTLGAPFGCFGSGVKSLGKGLLAPAKVTLDAVLLPFSLFGVDFGSL